MKKMNEKINQAFTYFDNGELDKAEQIYRECLREVQDKKSQEYRNILHGLGYVKSHNNDFDGARKIYMELIEIAQSSLNKKFEAIALHQLGMVERLAKNFNEALLLFQNEQQMLEKYFPDFFVGMSANFYEQGMIFLNKKDYLNAEKFMKESLHFAHLSQDMICLGCSYRGLGEIFKSKGEQMKAKSYFIDSIEAFKKVNETKAIDEVKGMMTK